MQQENVIYTNHYALLIDKDAEIKGKGWRVNLQTNSLGFIDDDEYYNRPENKDNYALVIAYYPLTKEAKDIDLPLLPCYIANSKTQARNFYKQLKNPYLTGEKEHCIWETAYVEGCNDGISISKQFSLRHIEKVIKVALNDTKAEEYSEEYYNYLYEKIIKSLSSQQIPKTFIPEYEYYYHSSKIWYADAGFVKCNREVYESIKSETPSCPLKIELKIQINSNGKEELVGRYIYSD